MLDEGKSVGSVARDLDLTQTALRVHEVLFIGARLTRKDSASYDARPTFVGRRLE